MTLETIDQKLERIVELFVALADELREVRKTTEAQAIVANQQAEIAKKQAEIAKEQSETAKGQAESINRLAIISEQNADIARVQAESVRELVRLLNQRGA